MLLDKTQAALRTARKYAEGGSEEPTTPDEWAEVPRSPEGRPQITVTKPPVTPTSLVSEYAKKASDWWNQPTPIKPETPPQPEFNAAPEQQIGSAVRSAGTGIAQHYKDLVDPFEKNDEGKYVADQPIPETPGKIPAAQKDTASMVTPILGEVVGTFGGPPGTGLGWAGLKAAGFGINHAAIAFGFKAAQQAPKVPKTAGAATKIAAEQGYLDTTKFKQVGHQLGFMPGGVYKDPTGVPYYLKFGTDLEQVKNENLASKLYQLAGTPAAETSVTHIGGKPGIASKLLQDSHQLSETKVPYSQIPGLHDNFVVDAWLANHDAVGTGGENPLGNIMIQNGKAIRIDGGGALTRKGSGELKNHFHDEADEIFSMRNPEFSKRSAQVFGDISPEALKEGAQKVADVDIRKLTDLIARYGPGNDQEKAALVTKLLKRRQYIMDHFGVQPKNAAQPIPEVPNEWWKQAENDLSQIPRSDTQAMVLEKDFSEGQLGYPRQEAALPQPQPDTLDSIQDVYKAHVKGSQSNDPPGFLLKDTILNQDEIARLLQDQKLGTSELQKIAKKLVAGAYNHDHWKGATTLWKIAEHVNPQTAEALFRNLPPSVQPSVGYAIKAMAEELGKSPFDTVSKGSGYLYAGKYPTNHDYYSTQTNKFEISPSLKKDKVFLENVKKYSNEVHQASGFKYPEQVPFTTDDKALQELHELSEATTPTPKKSSLVIPPKELVYTLSQYKYGPDYAAKKLVNAYGEDVSKIANSMYRLATAKSPEYVDEIYKKLPFELKVGANGELSEIIAKHGDPWAANFKNKIPTQMGKKILDHLEQIPDWQSYTPKIGKFEAPIFPDAATKKKAEQTGHNINVLLWKGHNKAQKYPEEFKDFSKKMSEKANFLTHEKAIAASGNYGGNKSPLVARAPVAYRVDYEDLFGKATYDTEVHDVIEAARTKGADVLVIDNIKDYGHHISSGFTHRQTQYAFINQNVLRAPHAKFDKDKLHLAKPMLGLAGGGLFVYGATKGDDKMNRGGIPALMHRVKAMARGGSLHPRHPAGMIKSSIPGRTDKIPMSVPPGSYIIPADIPSALGEGNTMAGEKILGTMFKSGPYSPGSTGQLSGKLPRTRPQKLLELRRMRKFAEGGEVEDDIPIIAAGGEYVIHPEQVAHVGRGDMKAGHQVLDKFVLSVRKNHIETLKKLKPPKQ